MAPKDFGRSVNPISTRRGRLCSPHFKYWHPRIFRPSYGPVLEYVHELKEYKRNQKFFTAQWSNDKHELYFKLLCSIFFALTFALFVAFCSFFPCRLTFFHRGRKQKSGVRQQKSSRADKQHCFP